MIRGRAVARRDPSPIAALDELADETGHVGLDGVVRPSRQEPGHTPRADTVVIEEVAPQEGQRIRHRPVGGIRKSTETCPAPSICSSRYPFRWPFTRHGHGGTVTDRRPRGRAASAVRHIHPCAQTIVDGRVTGARVRGRGPARHGRGAGRWRPPARWRGSGRRRRARWPWSRRRRGRTPRPPHGVAPAGPAGPRPGRLLLRPPPAMRRRRRTDTK